MSIFEKERFRIFQAAQHPLKHSLDDFAYTNPGLGNQVSTVQGAMDYIFAVLYPQSKTAVANQAALPLLGNSLNDYRVVNDDGDGKAASYRWEQREGEGSPSWHKIYDMDWGVDSILQQMHLKTQDLYVSKKGYDERDGSGNLIVGTLAGAFIYGGASANTNLTLYANSGDGAGPATGFVQFGDNARPITDNAFDFGTTALRFKKFWGYSIQVGTLLASAGSLTDSSGAINFGSTDLTTSGSIAAGSLVLASATFGTLTCTSGSITDSSGTISFGSTNLVTTGTLGSNVLTVTKTAKTIVLDPVVGGKASINSNQATLTFNALNLETTGTFLAGNTTVTRLDAGNIRITANTISVTNLDGDLDLSANGIGDININSTMNTLGQVVTGVFSVTGQTNADNLRLDGNTLSSTDSNGNILLNPNGTGLVEFVKAIFPTNNGTQDIGKSGNSWQKLWISGSIGGATEITLADLLTLRDINVGVADTYTLVYSAGSGKWVSAPAGGSISHGSLTGLSADDHTQYLLLAGRSGGQLAKGGVAAGENLTLDSTAHATKGKILLSSQTAPTTDATYSGSWSGTDLGGTSNFFRHVYTKGEHFNFRVENLGADFVSSSQNPGRIAYNTVSGLLILDTGSAVVSVGAQHSETDTVWTGSQTVKTVTVSGVADARKAIWQLKDNTNDFDIVYCDITQTNATTVVITVGTALPAGTYRLIGIQ